MFRGRVVNARTGSPIAAAVKITGSGFEESVNTIESNGLFEARLPAGTTSFSISVKAPGFMSYNDEVREISPDGKVVVFSLTPLTVGTTIRLNKVYFERGKAVLLDSSYAELDNLVEMLKENPDIKIELSGHTDNQGNAKLNLKLSQDRVEAVKAYLVAKGIDAKRIKGKGYGGTRPVASNASEETRRLNRRVEFKIIKSKVE
jgi:outer membrane protein OmpA-like peptidoglycan-associated protein